MAADMPRKAYRYTCNIVRPQAYSEGTIYESLMNAISDVVPQAYIGNQKPDDKEKILWVRFENTDCSDVFKNPDLYKSDAKGLPLLLILGYSNGVQIWLVSVNGEAQELLSIRQGPVKMLRVLPNPESVMGYSDGFSKQRPLVVMCDSSGAGQPYCGVKFVSLKTGDEVHNISFNTLTIQGVECNQRFVVVTFFKQFCVYEACQFNQLFWITSCYPCAGPTVNPIALSTRWLAYADKRLVPMHQSCGGMSGDGAQSYAATVISAAKGAFKGLSKFGETMMNTVTGTKPVGARRPDPEPELDNSDRPGIISVIDVQSIYKDRFNVIDDNEVGGLIAHFHAHANEPVAHMAFDPSGTLLVTACKLGHNFHIFRLMAHPCSSSLGAVHHLYTLYRGDTTAKVVDISFSHDSRWVTVSTHRGTTHLFPITPYGGPVNMRTHCQPCVVNRASRFQKSAGLEDIEHSRRGRQSPILSTSPGGAGPQHRQYDRYPKLIQQNTLNNNMGNPRLPPYPHPTTIYPAYQVKQSSGPSLNPVTSSPSHSSTGQDHMCCVAARFCSPRLCVVGSPRQGVDRRDGGKRPVDSLFIMTQSGYLIEYVLEPKPLPVNDRVNDSSSLDLHVTGRIQWCLQRWRTSAELRPPLPSNSPLILAHEAVMSQQPTAPDLSDLPGITRQDSKDSLSSDHSGKDDNDELWLPQIEIMTHVGPHRRLWMGPQFSFKTYSENTTVLSSNSSALLSQSPDTQQAMDLGGDEGDLESLKLQPTRSNPVSMPNARPAYRRLSGSDSSPSPGPGRQGTSVMVIEAGSYEHSPHLQDVYTNWAESTVVKEPRGSDDMEEDRIKETLADAMVESPIKDMEKMSFRQELPRTDVAVGKEKSQMEARKSGKERRDAKKESSGSSSSRAEGKSAGDSQQVSPRKTGSYSTPVKVTKSSESKKKDESTQAKGSFETVTFEMDNVSVACQTTVPSQTSNVGVQQIEISLPSKESNTESDARCKSNTEMSTGDKKDPKKCTSDNTSPEIGATYKSLTSSSSDIAISFNSLSSSISDQKSSPEVISGKKDSGSRKSISHTESSPEAAGFADTESSPDASFSHSTPKSKCASITEEKKQEGSSESSFEKISSPEVVASTETFARMLEEDAEKKLSVSKKPSPSKSKSKNVSFERRQFEETSSSDPFAEEETKDKQKNKGRKSKKNKNKNAKLVENISTPECEDQGKHEKDVKSFKEDHYAKEPSSNEGTVELVKGTGIAKVMPSIEVVSGNSEEQVDESVAFKEFSTPDSEHLDTNMEGWMSGLPSDKGDDKVLTEKETKQCMNTPHVEQKVPEGATVDLETDNGKSVMVSVPLSMLQSVYDEAIDDTVVAPDMPRQDFQCKPDAERKHMEPMKKQDIEESVYYEAVENPKSDQSCQIKNVHDDILSQMKEAILEEELECEDESKHIESRTTTMESTTVQTQVTAKKAIDDTDTIKNVEEDPTAWESAAVEKTVEDKHSVSYETVKGLKQGESTKERKGKTSSKASTKSEGRSKVPTNIGLGVMTEYDAEAIDTGSTQEAVVAAAKSKDEEMNRGTARIDVHLKDTPEDETSIQAKASKSSRKSNLKDTASLSEKQETSTAVAEKSPDEGASISVTKDSKVKELQDAVQEESIIQNSPPGEAAGGSSVEDVSEVGDKELSSGKSSTAEASSRSSEERASKEDSSKTSTSSKKKKKKKNRK